VKRAHAAGCDVLAYDLTRPDVGFPVVKVIVPGLRHFWRRLGPGRLYDVPVQLGWVDRAKAEDGMNPASMFV
jgi:ribosomal protein S12 methylthiotransferase accessory factor